MQNNKINFCQICGIEPKTYTLLKNQTFVCLDCAVRDNVDKEITYRLKYYHEQQKHKMKRKEK